jgi:RNA polymerase sigma factor (sigma-70 family)
VSEVGPLVHAAAGGDQAAWNELVTRYNGLVWSVARAHLRSREDAADVVQTTWLRFAEHVGALRDPERLGGWLATTARRESLRALRLAARQIPSSEMELLADGASDARVDVELLTAERDGALWRSFAGLSTNCQALLRLLVAEPPLSYGEISASLDIPIGSIGPTRARCLENLRARAEAVGISRESGSSRTEGEG